MGAERVIGVVNSIRAEPRVIETSLSFRSVLEVTSVIGAADSDMGAESVVGVVDSAEPRVVESSLSLRSVLEAKSVLRGR